MLLISAPKTVNAIDILRTFIKINQNRTVSSRLFGSQALQPVSYKRQTVRKTRFCRIACRNQFVKNIENIMTVKWFNVSSNMS